MTSDENTSDESTILSLPSVFSVLRVEADTRRKGKRWLACLDQSWQLHVFVAPPGICIVDCPSYEKTSSMIFMQCTNASKSSVGFVCVGRQRCSHHSKSGLLDNCFLCIVQAIFIKNS